MLGSPVSLPGPSPALLRDADQVASARLMIRGRSINLGGGTWKDPLIDNICVMICRAVGRRLLLIAGVHSVLTLAAFTPKDAMYTLALNGTATVSTDDSTPPHDSPRIRSFLRLLYPSSPGSRGRPSSAVATSTARRSPSSAR